MLHDGLAEGYDGAEEVLNDQVLLLDAVRRLAHGVVLGGHEQGLEIGRHLPSTAIKLSLHIPTRLQTMHLE